MRLQGKIALVTGGARGIGFAVAQALAKEGAVPVIADINEAGAREALARLENPAAAQGAAAEGGAAESGPAESGAGAGQATN